MRGKLSALVGTVAILVLAWAGLAAAAQYDDNEREANRTSVPDIASLALMQPGPVSHPYSFADLFSLTVSVQHGLVTGTTNYLAGALRSDWSVANSVTPAVYGGVGVPGLAHGLGGPGGSMIGLPSTASIPGSSGLRLSAGATPPFHIEKTFLPLADIPRPAGWLILLTCLLVVFFIARRRARGDSA